MVSIGPVGVGVDGAEGTVLARLEIGVVDGVGVGVGEDDVSVFNATVEDNANIDAAWEEVAEVTPIVAPPIFPAPASSIESMHPAGIDQSSNRRDR